MAYISTILAAVLCATAPLASREGESPKSEKVESNFKLGKETVASIRSNYENGKFNQFMFDMDEFYKKGDLTPIVQLRENGNSQDLPQDWEAKFSSLQRQKNSELLAALSEDDTSIFASKVRSLSANILTPEQEKVITRINSFIAKAPNTGANVDENTLIDIDIEYEYKLLHLEDAEAPNLDKQALQIALRMEKMDKMHEASKSFEDKSLKQAVELAHATLDARLARNLDGADLNALAKKKTDNKQEEVVYSIIRSYQGQFSDLMKTIR